MEQHVPLTGFVPRKPKLLPSKTNTIPYVGYVTQISARPPQCWVHADGAHPAQTGLSVRENQRLLLDRGLLHRPGMSGKIWKINLTIASVCRKQEITLARGETLSRSALVHVIPR